MKSSKIDRIISVVVIGTCLIKAVLYGGSKPSTNDLAGATGVSPVAMGSPDGQDARRPSAFRPMMAMSLYPTNQLINHVTNWTARGAYCDWMRVTFPDDFAFPYGTNLLTGVTVMAYGEVRCNDGALAVGLRQSATTGASSLRIISLPHPVSLEPDASSFSHGLTSSNTYLFAWSNACVEREATNRVDASIELFAWGDMTIRFGSFVTNIVARPPEGFVGEGQDDDWIAANWPGQYAAITNKGYGAWLDEDYVGVNEQNGHYRADITVASLPDNGVPCYLVCGPYRVVVDQPGTYSFPLEVFENYRTRTYPIALPLAISTDDGYRDEPSFMNASPMLLGAPRPPNNEYDIYEEPRLVISPTEIPLDQAVGTHISIWCNVANAARSFCASVASEFRLCFLNPSDAEIEEAEVETTVEIILESPKGTCSGYVYIGGGWWPEYHPYHWCCWSCCGYDCRCDGTCCDCTCGCHD